MKRREEKEEEREEAGREFQNSVIHQANQPTPRPIIKRQYGSTHHSTCDEEWGEKH